MKTFSFTLFAIFLCLFSSGQYTRHIVQFRDKNGTQFSIANPSAYLSAKAIARRNKQNIKIDSTDLPLSKPYLDSIAAVPNVTVLNLSKWLNQALIQTSDANALTKINSFPFVKAVIAIAPIKKPGEEIISKQKDSVGPMLQNEIISGANGMRKANGNDNIELNYGNTFNQIHIHEGEYLHDLGFTGRGITIAMLDAGFKFYKTNPAFDSLRNDGRVLGEVDYVDYDGNVNDDDQHGANCLSIIVANRPGIIVGSAPHASFWLFHTEDVNSEYPVEEQNWTAAAEFADSAGADMISTSLGYNIFDDPSYNHTYAQRDGHTTMITRAANFAADKGMIVTVSAGNDGRRADDYKYVAVPADADSVLAVGAIDVNGLIASFSSWGPSGGGRIKPDVVSVGARTVLADANGNPVTGFGTSYSNPNMAGLVACLWQAFPEFRNMEILDYIRKSSDRYDNPDGRYGYGIPNFHKAYDMLLQERKARQYAAILGNDWIKAFPVPYQTTFNIIVKAPADGNARIQLFNTAGQLIDKKEINTSANQVYLISFSRSVMLSRGAYFIKYTDGKNKATLKIIKQ